MGRSMRAPDATIWLHRYLLPLLVTCALLPLVAPTATQFSASSLPFAVRLGEEAEEVASEASAGSVSADPLLPPETDGLASTGDLADDSILPSVESDDLVAPAESQGRLSLAERERELQVENNRLRGQAAAIEQRDSHLEGSVAALRRKLAAAENRDRSVGSESARLKQALHNVETRQATLGTEDAQLRKKTAFLASSASAWRARATKLRSKAVDEMSRTKQLTVENSRMRASLLNVVSGAAKRVRVLSAELVDRNHVISSEKLQAHRWQVKRSEEKSALESRVKSLEEQLISKNSELERSEVRERRAEASATAVLERSARTRARASLDERASQKSHVSQETSALFRDAQFLDDVPQENDGVATLEIADGLANAPPAPSFAGDVPETVASNSKKVEARGKALLARLNVKDRPPSSAAQHVNSAGSSVDASSEVALPSSQRAPLVDDDGLPSDAALFDNAGDAAVLWEPPLDGGAGIESDSAFLDKVSQATPPWPTSTRLPPDSDAAMASDAALLDKMPDGSAPSAISNPVALDDTGGSPSEALLAEVHHVMSVGRARGGDSGNTVRTFHRQHQKVSRQDAPISLLADVSRHERRRVGLSSLESAVSSEAREEERSSEEIAALHAQIRSWEQKGPPTAPPAPAPAAAQVATALPPATPKATKVVSTPPVVGSLLADREVDDLDREVSNLETTARITRNIQPVEAPAAALLETSAKRVINIRPIDVPVASLHVVATPPVVVASNKIPALVPQIQLQIEAPMQPKVAVPTIVDEHRDLLVLQNEAQGHDVKQTLGEPPTQAEQAPDPIAAFASQAAPKVAEAVVQAAHSPDPIAAFVSQASELRQKVLLDREAKASPIPSKNAVATPVLPTPAALDVSAGADDDIKSIVLDDDLPAVNCTSSSALSQTPASSALSGLDHFKALVGC